MAKVLRFTGLGLLIIVILAVLAYFAFTKTFEPDRTITYRQINGIDLSLHLFEPETTSPGRAAHYCVLPRRCLDRRLTRAVLPLRKTLCRVGLAGRECAVPH